METTSAEGIRTLAAWLSARRELTERVEVLLMHGPTAVDRVRAHLDEVRAAYAREQAAFEAFATGAPLPPAARSEPDPDDYPPLRSVPVVDRS